MLLCTCQTQHMNDAPLSSPTRRRASWTATIGRRAAAVAVLLAGALSVAGCGYNIPPLVPSDPPAQGALGPSELSTLDPDGVERIIASGQARFDLSDGEIPKSAVGLAASDYAPDVNAHGKLIDLEIVGPTGTLEASTDYIRFFTTDASPSIPTITYFLAADDSEDYFQLLRDGSDAYGIDGSDVEAWIESMATDSDGISRYSFQPGNRLGMNVNYELRYDRSSPPQVILVEVYP